MSAQSIRFDDPHDPAVIVRSLPEWARPVFLGEFEAAALAASDAAGRAALEAFLHQWAARAVAYARPGFRAEQEAAARPVADGVALETLIAARRAS